MSKRRQKKKSPGRITRFVKRIVILALLILAGYIGSSFIFPDVSKMKKTNPEKTSFMKYREKQWHEQGKKTRIRKKWVPLKRISPYLVKAVMIAEDDKFWSHHGFDLDALQNALEKNIEKGGFKFGGSTISQQLVKNLYLTPRKTPVRKIKEAIITWRLERTLSKRRILELYLNVIEWGDGIFGAEAASQRYFGKTAASLSPEEAAKLAVVLPNPIKFKVNGSSRYTERRARIIYNIMVRRGIVIPQYEEIIREPAPSNDKETIAPPGNGKPSGNIPPENIDDATLEPLPS